MISVLAHRPGWKALLAIAFVAAVPLAAACGGSSKSSTTPTIQSQPAGTSPTVYSPSTTANSPVPSATTAPASPTAAASPTANGPVEVKMTAKDEKFDKSEIDAAPGATVNVSLDNEDTGFHNIGFYTAQDTKTPIGTAMDLFKGPNVTKTITITAPTTPGTYYFQCDVHPTTMNGKFVVK